MMPVGLLNTLKRDEILDLTAYLLSRGDRENPMFHRTREKTGNAVAPKPKASAGASISGF
jgi:hypothetical protein